MAFKKGDLVWFKMRISDDTCNKYRILFMEGANKGECVHIGTPYKHRNYLELYHLPSAKIFMGHEGSVELVKPKVDKEFEEIWI